LAQAVAGNMRDVGVDIDLIGADWASFLAAINVPDDKGTAHMHLFNWAPGLLDASQQMTQFVRGQWPPAGLATSHYWNPKVELLVSEALREADDQRRQDEYAEAQRIVWDDAPWIFLWSPSFLMVHSARVQGLTAAPTENPHASRASPRRPPRSSQPRTPNRSPELTGPPHYTGRVK
jgi:peptide/nickel transport system substrate-binding protein